MYDTCLCINTKVIFNITQLYTFMQPLKNLDKHADNNNPIILLDYSGSTMAPFYDQKRIIDHLVDLIKQVAQYDNFDHANVVLFSDTAFNVGTVSISNLDIYKLIVDSIIEPGSTQLAPALVRIDQIIRNPNGRIDARVMRNLYDSDDESEEEEVRPSKNKSNIVESNKQLTTIKIKNDPNKNTPIYIFTDGEVDDDENVLLTEIKNTFGLEKGMIKRKLDLRMIILESNDKNYFVEDCSAGNVLVKTLRNSNMTELLKYVFFFNRRYRTFSDRFVNMYSAVLPDDYVQYDDKCFHIRYYPIFLANITQEIADLRNQLIDEELAQDQDQDQTIIPKEDMLDDIVNELIEGGDTSIKHNRKNNQTMGRLEKIGYNLIKTIRDLEKASKENKNFNKIQMIDFFCNIIGIDDITDYLRRELIYGVDNKTFQEYKTKRGKMFNRTQLNMYTHLQKTICNNGVNTYTSFLENDCVYDIETFDVEHSINLGFREYRHAGVYDTKNKRLVPILPIQEDCHQHKYKPQIFRQWLRANYSKRYGIPAGSDLIHYTFLLDNLYIQCSKLPKHIKDAYNTYASLMFDRTRYGESIHEKTYLMKGELPKPLGSKEDFRIFLPKCPNYVRMINCEGEVFDPMTVWFMMLAVLCHKKTDGILDAQIKNCPDIVHDGLLPMDYDKFIDACNNNNIKIKKRNWRTPLESPQQQVLKRISWTIRQFKEINYRCIKLKFDPAKIEPNYYCYITLTDTSNTGGYMFYAHPKRVQRNEDNNEDNNDTITPNSQNLFCRPSYVISYDAYNAYIKGLQSNNGLYCPYCGVKIDLTRMTKIESKDEYEQREDVVYDEKEKKKMYCKVEIYDNFSDNLIELNRLEFRTNYRHRVFFREHIVLANPMDGFGVMKFETPDKQTEFNKRVPKFLLDLDWTNITVAGGMCRSILLGQKIQDIDIFFVGLDEEGIKNRVVGLINDIVSILQQEDSNYRFILMYKPLNSVIEILCTRSTFDENSIDMEDENITIDEKFLFIHNEIVHKIQIILRIHESINEIFTNFDIYPSCVAFDGTKTYFNEASYVAYRYMINMVDREKSTHESYDYRIMKYYKYGFSLALDKKHLDDDLTLQIENTPKMIKISGCIFELLERPNLVNDIDNRYIMLNSFRLTRKNDKNDKTDNSTKNNKIQSTKDKICSPDIIQVMNSTSVKDKPLYESFDTDNALDATMIGLYNYMTKEDIRYCYLMGPTNEEELEDVLNVDQIEFLKNRRIGNFNWYDTSNIVIAH
jgi:hypothetical protein